MPGLSALTGPRKVHEKPLRCSQPRPGTYVPARSPSPTHAATASDAVSGEGDGHDGRRRCGGCEYSVNVQVLSLWHRPAWRRIPNLGGLEAQPEDPQPDIGARYRPVPLRDARKAQGLVQPVGPVPVA